ncbi:hypothetical protein ACJMK2_003900, partial [Sinanodonta woodiana]
AVSGALTGSENFHELLRLRTAIELILYPIYYDEKSNSFVDLIYAIVSGFYSAMAHIHALSASISTPISSYYPPQLQAELASQPFNRKVVGRSVNRSATPAGCLMWTQTLSQKEQTGTNGDMVIINIDESLDDSVDDSIDVNSDMTAKQVSNESHTDIIDDVTEIHNDVNDGIDTYNHPADGKLN